MLSAGQPAKSQVQDTLPGTLAKLEKPERYAIIDLSQKHGKRRPSESVSISKFGLAPCRMDTRNGEDHQDETSDKR